VGKAPRSRALVEARGCSLVYLPPYSPDFSPIEEAFSKLKMLLRKAKARTRVALLEAIGRALPAITPRDAAGYFGRAWRDRPKSLMSEPISSPLGGSSPRR
jgi:hypothetical protein